jgi:YggT family protein
LISFGSYPTGSIGQILWSAEGFLVQIIVFAIIAQALLSWFVPQGVRRLSALLYDLTQPIIGPIRQTIPPFGALDLSPLIALLVLEYLVLPVLQGITGLLAGG